MHYTTLLENHQAVYLSRQPLAISRDIDIKPLNMDYFEVIMGAYDVDVGADYLKKRLEDGELFGGFADSQLAGFVGIHAEGSMGMLQVFDQYRGRGYGAALTSHAVNHQLAQGVVPFEQIGTDNKASLAIAQKLGFLLSTDKMYWLF